MRKNHNKNYKIKKNKTKKKRKIEACVGWGLIANGHS